MEEFPKHDFEASDADRLVEKPEVSVGIITYNHERYLPQALDSVIAQRTSFPFEIIVYEDCSTDRTREIALEYQQRHPDKIRVLYSRANVGVGENAKRGVAACRGRYAAGLDGDDFWTDPTKLQRQYDALEAHPDINMCFTRAFAVLPSGETASGWDYGPRDRRVSRRELLKTPGMLVPTSSVFFRTKVLHDSPDWIFEAPVIDVFHTLAGAGANGAWYIASETAAYRMMAAGSWSIRQSANYQAVKLSHSRRMLDSWLLAERTLPIPRGELRFVRGLPHYVLARHAAETGRAGDALRHVLQMGFAYPWFRVKRLFGWRSSREAPID